MSLNESAAKTVLRGCGWAVLWVIGVAVGIPVASFLVLGGPYLLGWWLVDNHPEQAAFLAYPALAWIPVGAVMWWQKFQQERGERHRQRVAERWRALQHKRMRLADPDATDPEPIDMDHAAFRERSCEVCAKVH